MGHEIVKNGEKLFRFGVMGLRESYRLIRNHPFVVGSVFWFVFLYRNFPFLFSLLIYNFPVLVCTAALLGTLLNFGQSQIDDFGEEHEKVGLGFERSKLKKDWSGSVDFVERYERFGVDEGFTEEKMELVEKCVGDEPLVDDVKRVDGIEQDHGLGNRADAPNDLNVRDIILETRSREELDGEGEKFGVVEGVEDDRDARQGDVGYGDMEGVEDEGSDARHEEIEALERYASLGGSMEAEDSGSYRSLGGYMDAGADDQFDSLLMSWKRGDEHDADDESSESGSDGAESSSPDASMANIIPLLDELNLLLESANSQQADLSRDAFTLPLEGSIGSSESSSHSDVGADDVKAEEDGASDEINDEEEDEEEEEEEEEEADSREVKEDITKTGITWTEDDQKNLMELDISELERNQRLENLIARRRARKSLGMMMERNLIDFDGMDVFQVAPISTRRRNPFDLSHDSDYGMGLPPIPGSAPSALHPRHNPFDLPYDSSEEKPDLRGDGFHEEFIEFSHVLKEPVFRRNETFSIGSSSLEFPRYEGGDTSRSSRFRPYFVTEGAIGEGTSYSFQRLPSDLRESKLSSVAETESTSAVVDEDEMKLIDHDEMAEETDSDANVDEEPFHVEPRSLLSENVDSVSDAQYGYEKRDSDHILPEIELGGNHQDAESDADEAMSLPDTDLRDSESIAEADVLIPDGVGLVIPAETAVLNAYSSLSRGEVEDKNRSSSTLSSLSEEYNVINVVEVEEKLVNLEHSTSNFTGSVDIPSENLAHATDLDLTSDIEDDSHIKDPVYDSSPRGVKSRYSSFSSDLQRDASFDLIQLVNEQSGQLESEEPKVPDEFPEKGTPAQRAVLRSEESTDSGDHYIIKHKFMRADEGLGEVNPSSTENVIHLDPSVSDTSVEKEVVVLEDVDMVSQTEQGWAPSYYAVTGNLLEEQEIDNDILDISSTHEHLSLEDVNLAAPIDIPTSVSETKVWEEANIDGDEEDLRLRVSSCSSDQHADLPDDADAKLASALDGRDSLTDKSFIPTAHGEHEEEEATNFTPKHEDGVENELSAISVHENLNCLGLQEPLHTIYSEGSYSIEHTDTEEHGDDLIVRDSDTQGSKQEGSEIGVRIPVASSIDTTVGDPVGVKETIYHYTSDIKEIDEELLLELEAVGDFMVPLDLNPEAIYMGLPNDFSGVVVPDTVEVQTSADVPVVDVTSLGDDAGLEKLDPLDERNDDNFFRPPEAVLQESITEDRPTELLVSDMRPESAGYNPAFGQIDDHIGDVAVMHSGDDTGLRHPEFDQLQKDESMPKLALHPSRSVGNEQNHNAPAKS
ncbi:hypothetical protein AKJ16_DCAP12153 [Drosera capensis]